MSLEFEDEKGKKFTEIITKTPVSVLMQTATHRVRGKIHIRPDQRLKAELDRDEPFIAVTDAVILDNDGAAIRQTAFLAVRRDQIVWVLPEEDEK